MEQFAKLPRWVQVVAVLIIGALFFGAAWFLYLSDQKAKYESQLTQRSDLEVQIRQGKEAQKRVSELTRQIETIRRDLEVLKSIIPVDPDTGKLLRVFQTYARDQNLNISKISPSTIVKNELYSQQAYGMDVSGGYHDLALFFDKIAHMRRIVNITDLKMQASRSRGATLSAHFNSLVYMQNPEAFKSMESDS